MTYIKCENARLNNFQTVSCESLQVLTAEQLAQDIQPFLEVQTPIFELPPISSEDASAISAEAVKLCAIFVAVIIFIRLIYKTIN